MNVLEDIKVLDLSRTLAGPFCTMLLGDLGADIIKVEQPGTGDETRNFIPPTWNGVSTYYLASNRNKRSIVIDLKSAEGREIIYQLAKESDVLVENFRTGALDKMGLGYDELSTINPRLIYCSISGFGRTGPEKNRAGYDLLLQGYGGLMSVTGYPGGPPVKAGQSIVDLTTGMFAALSIQSAIIARGKTGKGQWIDVSLFDGQVALLNYLATSYLATGKTPGRMGSAHPTVAPYQAFTAKDMPILLAVANDGLWAKCCKAMGWTDLMADSRFTKNEDRIANLSALEELINERFSRLESQEIFKRMDEAGVPCGPIHTVEQVLNHPQVHAREMIVEMEHPLVEHLKMPGFPVKLSDTPATMRRHPPLLGEHTEEILRELGLSQEEIEELFQKRVAAGLERHI